MRRVILGIILTLGVTFAQAADDRRLFVVVFDLVSSEKADLLTVRGGLARWVLNENPNELFAIATYSTNGVELATPFFWDAPSLQRGLARLTPTASKDPLGLVLTEQERLPPSNWSDFSRRVTLNMRRTGSASHQLDALGKLATRLAPLQGSKHVVLVSGGFDRAKRFGIDELRKRFAAAHVVLDTIELGNSPGTTLATLASESGGLHVRAANDVDETLVQFFENASRESAPGAPSTDPLVLADMFVSERESSGPEPELEAIEETLRITAPAAGELWIYHYSANQVAMAFQRQTVTAGQSIELQLKPEIATVKALLVASDGALGLAVIDR
ncbi:MAG TPA: hypothetical protein VHW00_04755 [Thermoanaerobaculia bacterium]|nr:hypothetical protein [Thermoanaerobaculia bacterium]